jgi:hypothetical protein
MGRRFTGSCNFTQLYQDDGEIATLAGLFRRLLFRLTADGKISYTYSVYLESPWYD